MKLLPEMQQTIATKSDNKLIRNLVRIRIVTESNSRAMVRAKHWKQRMKSLRIGFRVALKVGVYLVIRYQTCGDWSHSVLLVSTRPSIAELSLVFGQTPHH